MKIDESNISKFNFITILLLVIFFAVAIIYSSYSSKEKSFEELKNKLQTKFIEDKKKLSKENVLTIHKFLKSNANSQRLTLSEKKEYILNMYKELNKDNPYEYYFVFDLIKDNNEYVQKILLHPLVPFGKVLDKNVKDLDGNLYVQNIKKMF
ncbi:MAG: hypothetical protein C0625_05400 [Arcobacter sp.]|nr:MAG: hypothetical protein C0625_05400 [Arcobacter sp.]